MIPNALRSLSMARRIAPYAAMLCLAAPVAAKPIWLIVGQAGSKPERVAFYASGNSVTDRTDPEVRIAEIMRKVDPKTLDDRLKQLRTMEMTVIQVFESSKAPAHMRMDMAFDCGKRLFRIKQAEAIARNRVSHKSARPEWQKVPANWIDRALFIACEEDTWRHAAVDDLNNGKGAQPKLSAHGVAIVGTWSGYYEEAQATEFTFEKLWTDGTRVPFNENRNAEEEKIYQAHMARNAEVMELNKQAGPALDAMIGALEMQLSGMDKESKFREEIANNFKKHKGQGGDNEFWGLQALTEQQLVDIWGAPTSASNHGELRMLRFTNQEDNRQTVTTVDQKTGAPVATETVGELRVCDVTFKLQVGGDKPQPRVVDYNVVGGQGCRLSTLRKRF